MVGQGGWLGVCRHPSIEVSAPRFPAGARYTINKSRAKQQKAPCPKVITLGRGTSCLKTAFKGLFEVYNYLLPRPNSVADGSIAFRIGPATAATAANAKVFRSVVPARYRASTAATAARA